MITAMRGHAPQATYIRNAKRLASPATLRRYHRVSPTAVSRLPYSTESDHVSTLRNGPNVPVEEQFKEQGYTVIRGGFGNEEEEDAASKSRPKSPKEHPKSKGQKSHWGGLRSFEPANYVQPAPEKAKGTLPTNAGLGDVYGEPNAAPENTAQRTTQKDIISLCTYTPWEQSQEWGYLYRGFEFADFGAARSFMIEAMQLKDTLGAHMHLSNFGRYVFVQIGTPNESYETPIEPRPWSLGDGDIDLGWALPKAAKKYMGKWQMDAAAKPIGDLGYSDSWEKSSRLVVPTAGRYHEVLDMRRPPTRWLTMEYRQLSQLGISATEVAEALLSQIAEDLMRADMGGKNMAYPVWSITEKTLAVSQTEFFCTSDASISKPGDGNLQSRETVILRRNFDLEQFSSMRKKERESWKNEVKDPRHVGLLLRSVTHNWRLATMEPQRHKFLLNISAETVYLKSWGPFLTKELRPSVRRVLARDIKEHTEHVQSLRKIYTKEAILDSLSKQDAVAAHAHHGNETLDDPQETGLTSTQFDGDAIDQIPESHDSFKRRNQKAPDDFGGLVSRLREKFDESQPPEQEAQDPLGRDAEDMMVRSVNTANDVRKVAGGTSDSKLWRLKYRVFRSSINDRWQTQKHQKVGEATKNLSTELVNVLSRVSNRSEEGQIDWKARYYELRRSAYSLGMLNPSHTKAVSESQLQYGPRGQVDWKPGEVFSSPKRGKLVRRHNVGTEQHGPMQEDEVLGSYRSSKQERRHGTQVVFYHWLPGEKLNLEPTAVEDNTKQNWRPNNFKEFLTREDMYKDPSTTSAPSSLITGVRRIPSGARPLAWKPTDGNFVRPITSQIDYLHWLPGDSFNYNKKGQICFPSPQPNRDEKLMKRREELMDKSTLDNASMDAEAFLGKKRDAAADAEQMVGREQLYQTREQTDEDRRLKAELMDSFCERTRHRSRKPGMLKSADTATELETMSTIDDAAPGPPSAASVDAAPNPEKLSTSLVAKSDPEEPQPSADTSVESEEISTSTDTVPEPEELSTSSGAELGPEDGGILNNASAEKLLEEIGIRTEERKSDDDDVGPKHNEMNKENEGETDESNEKEDSTAEKRGKEA